MEIQTTRFGRVTIEESLIITLPEGILGFEDFKRYIILDHFDRESPFKWLQSVEEPSLAFVITDPLIFVPHYKAAIPRGETESIQLAHPGTAIIAVIVNIKRDHSEITINLQGPLVINPERKLAKQVIIRKGDYSVRHVIFSKQTADAQSTPQEKKASIQSL